VWSRCATVSTTREPVTGWGSPCRASHGGSWRPHWPEHSHAHWARPRRSLRAHRLQLPQSFSVHPAPPLAPSGGHRTGMGPRAPWANDTTACDRPRPSGGAAQGTPRVRAPHSCTCSRGCHSPRTSSASSTTRGPRRRGHQSGGGEPFPTSEPWGPVPRLHHRPTLNALSLHGHSPHRVTCRRVIAGAPC
jgi:hypothetical protein